MGFGNGKVLKLEFNQYNMSDDVTVADQAMQAVERNNLILMGQRINESASS